MKDLSKKQFGRLTVVRLDHIKSYESKRNKQTKSYWKCLCKCGNVKIVRGEHLTSNKINSCGCMAREQASLRMKKLTYKHGLSKTPEYRSYMSMISRIIRPDEHHRKYYSNILIAERWLGENGFINFIEDMGNKPTPKHEIDRINNDGDYEPNNCRWVTHSENMQNTRRNKSHSWW